MIEYDLWIQEHRYICGAECSSKFCCRKWTSLRNTRYFHSESMTRKICTVWESQLRWPTQLVNKNTQESNTSASVENKRYSCYCEWSRKETMNLTEKRNNNRTDLSKIGFKLISLNVRLQRKTNQISESQYNAFAILLHSSWIVIINNITLLEGHTLHTFFEFNSFPAVEVSDIDQASYHQALSHLIPWS